MCVTNDVTQLNPIYWREHLDWQLLKKDEIMAILPANHPLSKQASVTVVELAEHHFLYHQAVKCENSDDGYPLVMYHLSSE